jgi:hypothetical protein
MAKLIFNDCTVLVEIGQTQDQLTPTYLVTGYTAAVTTCNAKSISIEDKINMVDLAGLCDVEEKNFITRTSGSISMEIYVNPATVVNGGMNGYTFVGRLGKYCRITFDPNGRTGVAPDITAIVRVGVIESVSTGAEVDGTITEKVTIRVGVA